jgi:hypothetical protein
VRVNSCTLFYFGTINALNLKIELMKLLILPIAACFFMLSCANSKEIETEVVETSAETMTDAVEKIRIVGHVRLTDAGCKIYIDALDNDGVKFKIYPENLDERFHKEGMYLKFYYDKTDTAVPADCDADMCASLSEVTPLRG